MLSQEKINLIQELYNSGMSKTDISKRIPCSIPTVTKYTEKTTKSKADEMIGQKFGYLTVLALAPKDSSLSSRCLRYVCQCKCGKIVTVNGNSLRTGHTSSCGCLRKGQNIKDLTNQKFGLLTAIKVVKTDKNRNAVWDCVCECGNHTQVTSSALLHGQTVSCGCLKRSLGETKIKQILDENNIKYIEQYRFNDCKNIKPLPFDFAIFDDNDTLMSLIEYQGDIHFKTTSGWNDEKHLLSLQKRDEIKRQYCKQNNIKLIEIPYTDYNKLNIEYIKRVLYD